MSLRFFHDFIIEMLNIVIELFIDIIELEDSKKTIFQTRNSNVWFM